AGADPLVEATHFSGSIADWRFAAVGLDYADAGFQGPGPRSHPAVDSVRVAGRPGPAARADSARCQAAAARRAPAERLVGRGARAAYRLPRSARNRPAASGGPR